MGGNMNTLLDKSDTEMNDNLVNFLITVLICIVILIIIYQVIYRIKCKKKSAFLWILIGLVGVPLIITIPNSIFLSLIGETIREQGAFGAFGFMIMCACIYVGLNESYLYLENSLDKNISGKNKN